MAEATSDLSVAERLARILDGGLLPAGGPAEAAERLIERLERPARVALLGLPGAGKSSILNLLAGTVVVPETLRLPTIVVQHGAVARMLCTLADGRVEAVAGSDLAQVLTRNPALVTLELALPALKVISLLEVSAGPIETEQRRAAAWASKRADILIWCTTSYLPKEAQVWEAMPDGIKDNGFLFLTKIDLLGGKEAAAGLLDRVEQRAGDEFRQVLAISARQARAAMPPGGPVDREMFRDSGAAAVIGAIKSRVQAARRADMDTAELLLARHVEAGGIVARRFAEAAPGDLAPTGPGPEWTPPPEMGADAAVSTRPVMPDLPEATRPPGATEPPPAAPRRDPDPLVAQPPEPRPEPEPAVEPDPVAASEAGPAAGTAAEPSDAAALTGGNKRLSERLKESPAFGAAASAPQMPLRTTWRSRAETRAIPGAPAGPEPAPVSPPAPGGGPKPPPQPPVVVAAAPADEGPGDMAIAAMRAKAGAATGAATGSATGPASARAAFPRPADPPVRTSVFGGRRPVVEAPAAAPGRTARPTEPFTRMRGPAPAAIPAPQAPTLAPDALATPRIAVLREQRPDGAAPERRERPRIAARAVAAAPAALPAAVQPVPTGDNALLDQAIDLITARSAELLRQLDPAEKLPVDLILVNGRRTAELVIEVLSRGTSVELRRITGILGEVLDLIQLMQLEKGHAPADDTMTLLLQARRDLETLRAS